MPDSEQSSHYEQITETPDIKGSYEQIARLYSRYHFAIDFCRNKDVVEVACGAGLGLGYLARFAKKVIGGDIDEKNLHMAKNTYSKRENIEVVSLDAHKMPFGDKSFDVVILYEAIYYLSQPESFIGEAHRILRDDGVVIICSVNKDWDEFNPSPFSHKYYSAPELYAILSSNRFNTELHGECLARDGSIKNRILGLFKKGAVKFHLMPKTMKRKELLKRIFFGKLASLPAEITEGLADYIPPVSIDHNKPCTEYKVLFAVGKKY
jgi:ubiquinone/menaquinone biosynthesis C-methylase UbiE